MRMLCSINLQFEGLVVLEAADGRHGLARARSERPDLVLTDVAVPRLDGFQLAEALRREEHTRQIPLIFLSGETTAANRARAGKRERPAAPRRTQLAGRSSLRCVNAPQSTSKDAHRHEGVEMQAESQVARACDESVSAVDAQAFRRR